ncbi:MAG: alcohol dehydrogenase catalytic domain-containing protein [Thermoproteus sp.]
MRAAVYYAPHRVEIEDREDPIPADNEVVIRPVAVGVCPTDVKIFFEGSSKVKTPVILGHEVAGVVVSKGKNVSYLEVGDRVNVAADAPCMTCRYCKRGLHNLCDDMLSLGFNVDGAYSTLMKVPSRFVENRLVYKIPDETTFEEAALIEPVAVSINALELVSPTPEDRVVIVGDGPNALIHLMLLKNVYRVNYVAVLGALDHRLKAALDLGADTAINVTQTAQEELPRILGPVDIVDVTVANKEAIGEAAALIGKATRVTLFGGARPDVELPLTVNRIHYDQVLVTGSSGTNIENYIKAYKIVINRTIDLRKIVTNIYKLDELVKAFNSVKEGRGLKSIVRP